MVRTTAGSFRNTQWDPILLISQIVAMQTLLYTSLGMIMFFMDLIAGANHTLDHIFEYHVSCFILGMSLQFSGEFSFRKSMYLTWEDDL